jgi:general secretion pathway protein N
VFYLTTNIRAPWYPVAAEGDRLKPGKEHSGSLVFFINGDGGTKMRRHFIWLSLALGTLCMNNGMNNAMAQAATGVALEENGLGRMGRERLPMPAVIQTPGAKLPPPGGNPLWGIPMSALTATRERPVFSPTRRPPAPPPEPTPAIEPPPPPAAPEQPLLTLVGTATGETGNVAVVIDQTTKKLIRLHLGEAVSDWRLRSIDSRAMTVEKDNRRVILALPAAPQSAAPDAADLPEAARVSRAF